MRKEDDRRKRKRAEKAERKAEEESRRKEELKRLKNLKKQEIQEKRVSQNFTTVFFGNMARLVMCIAEEGGARAAEESEGAGDPGEASC